MSHPTPPHQQPNPTALPTAPLPWIGIAPMRPQLIPSYSRCLDAVARERKYLMLTQAPALEDSAAFVQMILQHRFPMWVAFGPGPQVIGWCDIAPQLYESRSHVGVLGLGVLAPYRGHGIGRALITQALRQARTRRLERVELNVFSSNTNAIQLYRSLEFQEEGIRRRAHKLDGIYEDLIMMAHYL